MTMPSFPCLVKKSKSAKNQTIKNVSIEILSERNTYLTLPTFKNVTVFLFSQLKI